MNTWFSSMRLPSYGRLRTIAGPPVEKSKRWPAGSAAPARSCSPALSVKLQRTPAGRSRAKSYTQFFESAQRPAPFSAQSIVNGSTSRGSPNGTIGCANRAVTCRTPFTSPCGLKCSTVCAEQSPRTSTAGPARKRAPCGVERAGTTACVRLERVPASRERDARDAGRPAHRCALDHFARRPQWPAGGKPTNDCGKARAGRVVCRRRRAEGGQGDASAAIEVRSEHRHRSHGPSRMRKANARSSRQRARAAFVNIHAPIAAVSANNASQDQTGHACQSTRCSRTSTSSSARMGTSPHASCVADSPTIGALSSRDVSLRSVRANPTQMLRQNSARDRLPIQASMCDKK